MERIGRCVRGRMGNGASGVWSEVLGLWAFLKGEDGELRWYDPEAGKELETAAEVHAAREAAEARAAEQAAAREAAEARAIEEAAAREAAEARAIEEAAAREIEASARRAAEEKLAALEARLRTLERGGR